jgi:hypothetical protein
MTPLHNSEDAGDDDGGAGSKLDSFHTENRIINDLPFGSPGELPTALGGTLNPGDLPSRPADLLPSLSLASSSGAPSPNNKKPKKTWPGKAGKRKHVTHAVHELPNNTSPVVQ